MIFVTLGTHGQPFARLIGALSALPASRLVVQHGHSPRPAEVARAVAFMDFAEILEHIDTADTVITHAGVGSILCAARAGHTPVVVPRLARYGEHVDDHQLELTGALAERGMVVPARDLDRLDETIRAVPSRRKRSAPPERPLHAAVRTAIRPAPGAPAARGPRGKSFLSARVAVLRRRVLDSRAAPEASGPQASEGGEQW